MDNLCNAIIIPVIDAAKQSPNMMLVGSGIALPRVINGIRKLGAKIVEPWFCLVAIISRRLWASVSASRKTPLSLANPSCCQTCSGLSLPGLRPHHEQPGGLYPPGFGTYPAPT